MDYYTSPWVNQKRAVAYLGNVSTMVFVRDDRRSMWVWSCALASAFERIGRETQERGGNSVLGIELTIDPFALRRRIRGMRLRVEGTAAKLTTDK